MPRCDGTTRACPVAALHHGCRCCPAEATAHLFGRSHPSHFQAELVVDGGGTALPMLKQQDPEDFKV